MSKKVTEDTQEKPMEASKAGPLATQAPGPMTVPDYMQDSGKAGTEDLAQFFTPPRLKIVQKQSDSRLLELFQPGDAILTPNNLLVLSPPRNDKQKPLLDEARGLLVLPLLFWPEWCTWNPMALKGQEPAIVDRSLDPDSPIAHKARSPQLRVEAHPTIKDQQVRHVEHLNFLCLIEDVPEFAGMPVVLSFQRAGHRDGRNLCGLIQMRRAPIYGTHWELRVAVKSNQLGEWFGFEARPPQAPTRPWVDEKTFREAEEMHRKYKEQLAQAKIRVEYEDDPGADSPDSSDGNGSGPAF